MSLYSSHQLAALQIIVSVFSPSKSQGMTGGHSLGVEPVTTTKHMNYPCSHIKANSVLKGCWADMPWVCYLGRTLNILPNLFEDSELLHTRIHVLHREYAGRSENEYSSGLFLHDLTRGSLLDTVQERVSSSSTMTPSQYWIRPPSVSFKGEPGSMIVMFTYIHVHGSPLVFSSVLPI